MARDTKIATGMEADRGKIYPRMRTCLQILYPGSTSMQAKGGFLCTTTARSRVVRTPPQLHTHTDFAPHFQQALYLVNGGQTRRRKECGCSASEHNTPRAVARCVHATTRDIGSCPNTAGTTDSQSCRIRGQPPQQSTRNSLRCSHRPGPH